MGENRTMECGDNSFYSCDISYLLGSYFMEVKIWKHCYHGHCEFYLKGEDNRIFYIFLTDKDPKTRWVAVRVESVYFGNPSDPLSFLVIVGKSVEQVWRLCEDYEHIVHL